MPGSKFFGGVEGGGSHSTAVILKEDGTIVGSPIPGAGANPWQSGESEVVKVIGEMLLKAKEQAHIPLETPLEAVGLTLSGGEQENIQHKLISGFESQFPNVCKPSNYYVTTDTYGPVATAFPNGGMVLISGTGSNCELFNPEGDKHRCGGWGHMLGDEGSGYWIAHRAVKTIHDHEDGLVVTSDDLKILKEKVYSFFNLDGKYDILDFFYGDKFKKESIAKLCKEIAQVAINTKDPLCRKLFYDAGEVLGRHVMALLPKTSQKMTVANDGGVPILCEGDVFKSWELLRPGFQKAVQGSRMPIKLYRLVESPAIGAAFLGAQRASYNFSIDYASNTNELDCFLPVL